MKRRIDTMILSCLWVGLAWSESTSWAQPGTSVILPGVASGAMDITSDTTIALPPDGLLRYTTFRVRSGVTVTFQKNAANTPVFLMVDGAVQIDGTIDVSGSDGTGTAIGNGGPGGYDGGQGFYSTVRGPGAGLGPGGSSNNALFDWPSSLGYGSDLLVPMIGGSGGAGYNSNSLNNNSSGGGGGGAILVASAASISLSASGEIVADGGISVSASGVRGWDATGGSIRLVAPLVDGTGRLSVAGSGGSPTTGRLRIDTTDLLGAQSIQMPSSVVLGTWLEVDPLGRFSVPASNPVLEIVEVIVDGVTYPASRAGVAVQSSSATFVDVVIDYRNFPRGFTLFAGFYAEATTSAGSSALTPRRVSTDVAFDPSPIPSTGCYTDSTGSGSCQIRITSITRNVGAQLMAYVREF